MQDDLLFVGVDVAKDELAVATEPRGAREVLRNESAAICRWLDRYPAGTRVAMESTGQYHTLLARMARKAGMVVYVLNAHDVYYYAQALGKRGKTDASDAEVIARYVAEHHDKLRPWVPGTEEQDLIGQLLRRRSQIERHVTAIGMSLRGVEGLGRQRAAFVRQANKLLAEIDRKIQALIKSDTRMREGQQRLQTIVGIGPQTSATLSALLSRIQFENLDALVAYSGLDPRPADSGHKRGKRVLSKRGPAQLRRLLWLAAFSASHSKVFRAHYQTFLRRGLSSTEATVILARKLLRIAWAVWRTGKTFDAAMISQATACANP